MESLVDGAKLYQSYRVCPLDIRESEKINGFLGCWSAARPHVPSLPARYPRKRKKKWIDASDFSKE